MKLTVRQEVAVEVVCSRLKELAKRARDVRLPELAQELEHVLNEAQRYLAAPSRRKRKMPPKDATLP